MKQYKKFLFFFTYTAVINTLFAQASYVVVNSPDKNNQELFTGEKHSITYSNKRTFQGLNNTSKPLEVIFQVSIDGKASRNYIYDNTSSIKNITEEKVFHPDTSTKGFLQSIVTNPTNKAHYLQNIKVNSLSTNGTGSVYLALFNYNSNLIPISGALLNTYDYATSLRSGPN